MNSEVAEALEVLRGQTPATRRELQEIVQLVRAICGCEMAAISILQGDRYHLAVVAGLEEATCPSSETLCQHTMQTHRTVVVPDAAADSLYQSSPYVDGTKMAIRFYASAPLYSPTGAMIGRLCLFDHAPKELDDTQLRALNVLASSVTDVLRLHIRSEEPVVSAEAALVAEEEIARIAAEISHDMRTPLATILGNVELLQDAARKLDDPTFLEMLARTERAGVRLMQMVQQMLDFHRAGQTTDHQVVNLEGVAAQLVEDLRQQLEEQGATITVESLPPVVGNHYEITAVMTNLVSNALKFAKPDEPARIRIWASPQGRMVRIWVSDNGIGIPPHLQGEVFRMFGRATPRIEGHGIGLATVSRIVRSQGGQIGLRSDGHSGTEVFVDLVPAQRVPSQPGPR